MVSLANLVVLKLHIYCNIFQVMKTVKPAVMDLTLLYNRDKEKEISNKSKADKSFQHLKVNICFYRNFKMQNNCRY